MRATIGRVICRREGHSKPTNSTLSKSRLRDKDLT